MPGYVVARVKVTDQGEYERYTGMVPATLEPFGGRYLVRGGGLSIVEGSDEPRRIVILEFPTHEAALEWHASETYAPAKALREASAETEMMIVDGHAGSFDALVERSRSYRRFDESAGVPAETLRELVDLARLTPATANRQQLKYLLVTTPEARAAVFPTLRWAAALRDWAGPGEGEHPTAYVVILGDTEIAEDFEKDYPIAAQTIMLGATARGLGGCMIHNCERRTIRDALGVDERYEILLVLALGLPTEDVALEELPADGSTTYWRDEDGVHHVPKRSLDELILGER